MTFSASVVYPDKEGAEFDMDYYLKTHMPIVSKEWGPYGLKEWRVTHFKEGLQGDKPAYLVQAILYWGSIGEAKEALKNGDAVFGDIPKFTNISPIFTMGDVVGSQVL